MRQYSQPDDDALASDSGAPLPGGSALPSASGAISTADVEPVSPLVARPFSQRFAALRDHAINRSVTLRRWVRANTFTPRWLAEPLRRPWTGYVVTVVLEIVAVLVDLLLGATNHRFNTAGVLPLLVVAFIALNFGMGPSILATLLSALLFEFVVLPPHFSFVIDPGGALQVGLLLVVGGGISLVAGRTERSRQLAEHHAASEHAKQARLEAILTAVPSLISIYDAQGRLTESNRPQTGDSTATEKDILAALLERDAGETQLEPIQRALRGETISSVEVALRDEASGDERIVLLSAAPFTSGEGAIEGIVAVGRDITRSRRADRETAALAHELDAILRTAPDAVMVFGTDGRILRMNPAARDILDLDQSEEFYTLPQAVRGTDREVRDESDQPISAADWPYARILRGEALASGSAVDVVIHRPGKSSLELAVNGAPLRNEEGEIIGAVCVMRDVSERRRLERRTRDALNALMEMAHTLVDLPAEPTEQEDAEPARATAPRDAVAQRLAELAREVLGCKRVGITAVDPETDRLRFIAVVGLTPEQETQWWAEQRALEAQGVTLGDGADPDEMARFRAGEIFVVDMTEPRFRDLPNPYGVTISLAAPMLLRDSVVGMFSLDYAGERHVFTPDEIALTRAIAQFCAVVLERERLLRAREEAEAHVLALTEVNLQMDAFLGMAGHELKTPLTTSVVNTQLAQRRIGRLRAELARLSPREAARLTPHLDTLEQIVQRVAGASDRETRLVNDLLDVTRIQSNRLELSPALFDLAALTRETVAEQRTIHVGRTILLEASDEPLTVYADTDRIRQVITNYLTNALKYSPVAEPVAVRLAAEEGNARLCVTDHGLGIPAEEQGRVWDRFHRVPGIEVVSGSGVGLGLGLYICRQIIERQHGAVGLRSAPGAGSSFWFTLPLTCD